MQRISPKAAGCFVTSSWHDVKHHVTALIVQVSLRFFIKTLKIPFVSSLIALYFCLVTSSAITLVKNRGWMKWCFCPRAQHHLVPCQPGSCSALWRFYWLFLMLQWFFFFFFMVYLKAWGSLSALESPLQIPTLASINSAFRKEILKIEQKVINVRVLKVMDAVIMPSGERNNLCRLEGGTEGLLVAFAWGNCWWSCQSSYGKSEKMRLWITAPWHALVNRNEK